MIRAQPRDPPQSLRISEKWRTGHTELVPPRLLYITTDTFKMNRQHTKIRTTSVDHMGNISHRIPAAKLEDYDE